MDTSILRKISDVVWEISTNYKPGMTVPGRIIATPALLETMDNGVIDQLTNTACLPGVVDACWAMPDAHWGYGAPIGGVFATDPKNDGVISPGAVGFDINCGVRLLTTSMTENDFLPYREEIIDRLFPDIGAGLGAQASARINEKELDSVCIKGSAWAISRGWGNKEDLERTEEQGCLSNADFEAVSRRARQRALGQLGSLGSGNHYLEILKVIKIIDKSSASFFGIHQKGQIVVMIHCGSRGFGHQIATDYLVSFGEAVRKYKISIYDRQLACAPTDSPEGKAYFSAMAAAANFAFANRQLLTHRVRQVFAEVFKTAKNELKLIYDVAHNIAKWENGLLVHRKGATRAFGPGNPGLPSDLKKWGQPVIIGGSMETSSWLLLGTKKAEELTFASTCHGAGRAQSRTQAKKNIDGRKLLDRMREEGIYTRTASFAGLAEEESGAYKDVDLVIEAVSKAGISAPVAKFKPIGNIKG